MNAEELIIYLKDCVKMLEDSNIEPIILPTKGDPTLPQHEVSFIIMEKVEGGQIPRFHVDVKDLEVMRKEKK